MSIDRVTSHIAESEQILLKKSRDDKYEVLAVMLLGEDGTTARRLKVDSSGSLVSGQYALRIVEDGTNTYIGQADVGSATSSAVWRVKKIDSSTGTVVTWADGNSNFDNVWDNYLTLNYS